MAAVPQNSLIRALEKLGIDSSHLRRLVQPAWFGTLRRCTPLSEDWGFDRGKPVDRYYIESFLNDHRGDISGRVLEVKDSAYTDRFGTRIQDRAVLDIAPENPNATLVADLAGSGLPAEQFDCFVLTQTLQLIYNTRAAIKNAHRLLRPGGVLLATVPSVSRIVHGMAEAGDWWRFTVGSCRELFAPIFGHENVRVASYGNVLASVAFLMGVASEELSIKELETHDKYFPVIISVRAVKSQHVTEP